MESVWQVVKERVRSRVSPSNYQVWIGPLTYAGAEDHTLIIECPNQFFASWVQEHYLPLIDAAFAEEGQDWRISLSPVEIEREAARGQLHLPRFSPTEVPKPHFCQRFTFEEFVVGDSNRYAFEACWAAANGDCHNSAVLYLHSNAGLGKSHLTQAVGQHVLQRRPGARICYLTANDFTTQVVRAIRDDGMEAFKRRYRENCEVLMLEEVHCFAGRERTQTELAMALDVLMDDGRQVIFTGSQLPREIPKVNDHLRSRLAGGLIMSINPPDLPTRRTILARKARAQEVSLDDDVLDFLAEHLRGDIRQIEGAVVGLVAKSSLLGEPVGLDLAREVVRDLVGEPKAITVETVAALICRHFNISRDELCSRSRRRAVAWPRQVAMYLARRYTEASLEVIGRQFNRDHATVLHSVNRIKRQLEEPGANRNQIKFLVDRLEQQAWQS